VGSESSEKTLYTLLKNDPIALHRFDKTTYVRKMQNIADEFIMYGICLEALDHYPSCDHCLRLPLAISLLRIIASVIKNMGISARITHAIPHIPLSQKYAIKMEKNRPIIA